MSWAPLVQSSLEWLWRLIGVVTHVRVRAHRAAFVGPPDVDALFITVTNLSLSREIEVTHAWFELPTGQEAAINAERPLPVRLKPQQVWETWVPVTRLALPLPAGIESLCRIRLSDGRVVKGKDDPSVPHIGFVPGGPGRGASKVTASR